MSASCTTRAYASDGIRTHIPPTSSEVPSTILRHGRVEIGVQRGIRTPSVLGLSQSCLPLHHLDMVDKPGLEPGFPTCEAGALPLSYKPILYCVSISWTYRESNPGLRIAVYSPLYDAPLNPEILRVATKSQWISRDSNPDPRSAKPVLSL